VSALVTKDHLLLLHASIITAETTPLEDNHNKTTHKNEAARILGPIVFAPMYLLNLLISDEMKLRTYNKRIRESQRQGGTRERKALIGVSILLSALEILAFYLLFTGAYTLNDRSPIENVQMILRVGRLPKIDEIVNINVVTFLLGVIITSNVIHYFVYKYKFSAMMRFMNAMKDANIRDLDSNQHKIWYYPRRLAVLPLLDRSGDDLLKNTAMWNRSFFKPSVEFKELPGNVFIFIASKEKKSDSTMLYDRYDEWTELLNNPIKKGNWLLGEYVQKAQSKWKDMQTNFTMAFIGTSGSGKSEAMRFTFCAAKIMHPDMRFIMHDPKGAGDWDAFGPMCEAGKVLKAIEDRHMAFFYAKALFESRKDICAAHGVSNIFELSEKSGIKLPIVMVVVDEFPQFTKEINFDSNYKKNTTPAGILYEQFTMGRGYGVWFTLGTQFGLGDAVPSEVQKNIKARICLRVGSAGESSVWIDTDAAFRIGKGTYFENGEDDDQQGYAYIDGEKEYVRFWYADKSIMYHEFLKYKVPTMVGHEHVPIKKLAMPYHVAKKIAGLPNKDNIERDLPEFERKEYKKYLVAKKIFEDKITAIENSPDSKNIPKMKPLLPMWEPGEDPISYTERAYKTAVTEMGLTPKRTVYPQSASIKSTMGPGSSSMSYPGITPQPPLPPNSQVISTQQASVQKPVDTKGSAHAEQAKDVTAASRSVRDLPEIKRKKITDIFKSMTEEDKDEKK
jgi:hypothetical protein